jgi:hypothetical protein
MAVSSPRRLVANSLVSKCTARVRRWSDSCSAVRLDRESHGGIMHMRIWSGTCAAVAFGSVALVSAQNPPSSQTPTSQTRSSQSSSRSVTVSGCLQRGTDSATGTTGTASSSRTASAGGYLLINATPGSSAATSPSTSSSSPAGSSSATSSSSSSPSRATAGAGTPYRLDADESKLSPHVGHKVEVTGTIEESSSAGSSSAAGSATSTAAMSSPRLKVDSVKMVSSTCP